MEVDSNATKVATKSTQVALDTIEAATKIVHHSRLATNVKTQEVTKNLQQDDKFGIAPMVEQTIFFRSVGFLDHEDMIQIGREDNVKARKFLRPFL